MRLPAAAGFKGLWMPRAPGAAGFSARARRWDLTTPWWAFWVSSRR